jgi:hypothetical protein
MTTIRGMFMAGLMAAGVSGAAFLSASIPAWAADYIIEGSGQAGTTGGRGNDGESGSDGQGEEAVDGVWTGESGSRGTDGGAGEAGTDGMDGNQVTRTIGAPADNVSIVANGGNGGSGGKGGNGGYGGNGNDLGEAAYSRRGGTGGDGGNGGQGGQGGNGGAGGLIDLTVMGNVTGNIALSAQGGEAGNGGIGGYGGRGGHGGHVRNDNRCGPAYGGDGGAGGNGHAGVWGGNGGAVYPTNGCDVAVSGQDGQPGQSLGDDLNGSDGDHAGAGGSITVVLNASVGGNLTANAGTGTVKVTLNTRASVGGTIATNEAADSALRFAMTVNSRSDYMAAKAYLGNEANALSGSISINGQTFTWTGFDQLVDALVLAGVRPSVGGKRGSPAYLQCSPRAVTAFHKDGGIQLIATRTGERGAFRIGMVIGKAFISQNRVGWKAVLVDGAKGIRFDVIDGNGVKVATCG